MEYEEGEEVSFPSEIPNVVHKKMGFNTKVSTLLKNVHHLTRIKEKYINDYRKNRCEFVVNAL